MATKIADISTFENLQNQANQSMGFASSLSVFNGADPKKADVENENDKEIENAIDAKREIAEVKAKLKDVWSRFETERKNYEASATKLKKAKQSGDEQGAERALDACNIAKNWVLTYAEDIETMQKAVADLPKLSEVTTKPVIPRFVF
jgi:hypothetical protein